jgi:aminopeptidase N
MPSYYQLSPFDFEVLIGGIFVNLLPTNNIMRLLTILSFLWLSLNSFSQSSNLDILDYAFRVEVNDTNNVIIVGASIHIKAKMDLDTIKLDLVNKGFEGKGMTLTSAPSINNGSPLKYIHSNEELFIVTSDIKKDSIFRLSFSYQGIPANGLIIGENRHGKRTFFGDHWPNRAHHWLACIDHPSEKARINFKVVAPDHYQCVATGKLIKTYDLSDNRKLWHYRSSIDLPTKVQVIGIADLTIKELKSKYEFPISSWVYVDDSSMISDLDVAVEVVDFFAGLIGKYPYEKLANVQSTTMFGGMENAGNIFYDENDFTGKGTMEPLIAHEIAHQWFGNSASESDWEHLWLSEGFATYLTDIYLLNKYGIEQFNSRLIKERERVIRFYERQATPIVDNNYTDLMTLLNPNAYQKGAWVLHMLRLKIGNKAFFDGLRRYYEAYQFNNATTDDFQAIVEQSAGEDLDEFFEQWLYTAGHPVIKTFWSQSKRQFNLRLNQQQKQFCFNFPLDIEIVYEDGTSDKKTYLIDCNEHSYQWELDKGKKVKNIIIDPDTKLLFDEL